MRIGVFRPANDGRRTAASLVKLGHEAIAAPVLNIVATGATVEAGAADALVFTSAHAPEVLAALPGGIAPIAHLLCWCVGTRTAAAALSAGFTQVKVGAGDAASLAGVIAAEDARSRLLLVAGRDRKPDLEAALVNAGIPLAVVEAYVAEAVQEWPAAVVARLWDMDGAVHYSQRSAGLTFRLAEGSGLGDSFRAARHFCLSKDVCTALQNLGATATAVAAKPDEHSMMALIGRSEA